ncbi:MAG: caspase family protein, partial [Archangium sp.]|nr:caspase family protein [Archangium sp.]
MRRALIAVTMLSAMTALAQQRRQAIVIGANTGWAMDRPLRHAHDDAKRVAAVLLESGDFAAPDVIVLEDPTTEQVLNVVAQSEAMHPEMLVFFYSGHADAQHLHLQGAPLRLDALYARLKQHPSRVKIGVFDACQAGSLLAVKGARPTSTFNVKLDDAVQVEGTAILASSGADELSQEARALGGSVFTHHFVSGLRGAADDDGNGRVTVDEAYSYAAARTTLETAGSEAGAQRPVFRYELKGRGEVVLTQVRGPGSVVTFPRESTRCFVTDE